MLRGPDELGGGAGRDKGEGQIRLKRVKVCKVGIEGVWTLMRRGWEVGRRQGLGWWRVSGN